MMGKYFKGNLYIGTDNISSPDNVKAFGTYQANGYSAFMIINESSSSYASYTIHTTSGTSGSSIDIDMGTPGTSYSYTNSSGIKANSTHIVFFSCNGDTGHLTYTQTDARGHRDWTTSGTIPISLTLSTKATGCTSSTSSGTATVSASGGSGSYTYSWSSGITNTTASATTLAAGTYTVYVRNQTGCTALDSLVFTIAKDAPIASITTPSNANSCSTTQSWAVTASGGTPSYTYSWSNSLGNASTTSACTQPTGPNGYTVYTVTVTDNKGCTNTAIATHYSRHEVTISGPTTRGSCCGVTLTASGFPNATYAWTLDGNPITGGTDGTLVVPSGADNIGSFDVTATPINSDMDPCGAVTNATSHVVTASGNPCQCDGGNNPPPRLANFNSGGNSLSSIQSLIPNPSSGKTTIVFSLSKDTKNAEILLTNIYGQVLKKYPLSPEDTSIDIDGTSLADGIYFSMLLVNGEAVSTKKLVIEK